MRSLLHSRTDRHVGAPARAARIRRSTPETARLAHWPLLVEARTVTGDRHQLQAFVRVLRERAGVHLGHLGEVHFSDEGDRIRVVALWRSPTDLRSFVEDAHDEVLAYRAATGAFPTVERTLWWSSAGAEVTVAEAESRAGHLRDHGPGPRAFTLASPVPAPAG
ncbi:DUF3291 domain-containing protein [Nocardiopsis ganjiahuensis]|uniref:DUF3291 domain-containing protein n=1 Tax=Nocardiopsis ganjiahuensis TaxID=239984 RepID=UPI00034A4DAD|nr:DUF3291 domain-containing protein [Nocardiopsis ganjiahuensis]